MESKGVELSVLSTSALQSEVDLLAFIVFGDPAKDSIFKSVDQALDGVLADVARSESFEGKAGQSITVHTHGRTTARRVIVIGGGTRSEFTNPSIRDAAATTAQTANKVGAAT